MLQSVYYDVAQTGLKPPSQLTELYIPLWVYSSGVVSLASTASGTLILKGSTGNGTNVAVNAKLHTLSSNWQSGQKFAFEASIYAGGATTSYAALWDITGNALVSASQISTTATTATVMRSGQFTLTPGRVYGVTIWGTSGSIATNLNKAHLVALMS